MNYLYEQVKYDKNISGKILMQDKPGWRCNTAPHWHAELEFVYMIDGSLSVTRDGTTQVIRSGEFYFCNTKVIHSTKTPDNTANYKYLVLLLSQEFFLRFHDECMFQIPEGVIYEKIKKQLERLVCLAEPEYEKEKNLNLDIEKIKVILDVCQILLSECITDTTQMSPKTFTATGYAETIMEYVCEHYNQTLSLPLMADVVGLSPQYLSKYFKRATGMGVAEYINLIRLEYANKNLVNSDITVTEAALNNGFPNVKSYVRICKNVYGMTPTELRRTMRNVPM